MIINGEKDLYIILYQKRISQTLWCSKRVLTLLDSQSRSIWVGLSSHICLKAEHSPPLISCQLASWHVPPDPLCISESWLIVSTSKASDYNMAKTIMQIPSNYHHRSEKTEITLTAGATHLSYIRPISVDCRGSGSLLGCHVEEINLDHMSFVVYAFYTLPGLWIIITEQDKLDQSCPLLSSLWITSLLSSMGK